MSTPGKAVLDALTALATAVGATGERTAIVVELPTRPYDALRVALEPVCRWPAGTGSVCTGSVCVRAGGGCVIVRHLLSYGDL